MTNPFSVQQSAVSLVLWNPTNETLDMQYSGITLTMQPGDKEQFEINCARHLLNSFGQRGLTSLTYGADEEKVGKEAVTRNTDFKKKQVTEYNQRNESRKQMGLGYLAPTPHVKKYAIELGLELLEPYAIREEERTGIAETKKENEKLRSEISELREMMKTVISGQKEKEVAKPYICDECEKAFEYETGLTYHKKTAHKRKT
jgi:hypothetical protein